MIVPQRRRFNRPRDRMELRKCGSYLSDVGKCTNLYRQVAP